LQNIYWISLFSAIFYILVPKCLDLIKTTTYLLEKATLISTICLVLIVLLQIFARFFLADAPAWTEEASRIFFIYAISFGAGLALKDNYYVQMDLLFEQLSDKAKFYLELITLLFVLALFGLFLWHSIAFFQMGLVETSPSLKIPMAVTFASMIILSASLCFYVIVELRKLILLHR